MDYAGVCGEAFAIDQFRRDAGARITGSKASGRIALAEASKPVLEKLE